MTDTPTRGTAVRLTDLHRVYGGVAALDGLTLHIEPGEFVALLGPSGCGKTTALRCLAGLEDPDSGSLEVGGHDLTRVSANKRDMGMVFQAYSLFPHMTARQNVEFGLELRGRDRATRRARTAEMLDLVGLDTHADKYAHQLSGGQQQRVAIARSLANDPKVLLADEPTANLDSAAAELILKLLAQLNQAHGLSLVIATHDPKLLPYGKRVIRVHDGLIAEA